MLGMRWNGGDGRGVLSLVVDMVGLVVLDLNWWR